jgi:hypothetical protein
VSKLQSANGNRALKARDARVSDTPLESSAPRGNRLGASSDDGVWTAALAMGFAAFLMPVWFLAAGTAFGAHAEGSRVQTIHVVNLIVLLAGALVLCSGAGAAWILARAPRLVRGPHRSALRWSAIASLVGAILFINSCLSDFTGLARDGVACATAILPALLMAEVSIALPAIAKNRHGAGIARAGTAIWVAAGASLMVVGANPGLWWLPLAVSLFGAYCTGIAGMRVWQHYEGRIVHA